MEKSEIISGLSDAMLWGFIMSLLIAILYLAVSSGFIIMIINFTL